jgi:hypothetical protein
MKKHKVKLITTTLSWSHNHQSFSGQTDASLINVFDEWKTPGEVLEGNGH